MRLILIAALIALSATSASAYQRPYAENLRGSWEFVPVEPMIDLVEDRYVRPDFPTLSPQWDGVIDPAAVPPADAGWIEVEVPQAWEHYTSIGYNEAGWYRRTLNLPTGWLGGQVIPANAPNLGELMVGGRQYWLEFDAVATAAGVWVNGEFAGAHVGDYSRWRVEITPMVIAAVDRNIAEPGADTGQQDLEILVYVDELPQHITQGFLSMISPHHGGIWQGVRAYCTGSYGIRPDGVYVQTDTETMQARVSMEFEQPWDDTEGLPRLGLVSVGGVHAADIHYSSMLDFSKQYSYDAETRTLHMDISLADNLIELWSPDQPAMYSLSVHVPGFGVADGLSDQIIQRIAFREITTEGSQLLLNGEPLELRSVLNWGYYPGAISPSPAEAEISKELRYIKSLGFNAETICLVNMPDVFYAVADQIGVLIWQEYPTWHNDFDAKHLETYRSEFPAYLRRDRNHPSIIMRSLSVEAGVKDWEVIDELYSLAKELTDTPVQDNNSWFSHSRPEYTDWYGEDNYFNNAQWERHLTDRLPEQLDRYPEKPYIIGESILFNSWPDIDALDNAYWSTGDSPWSWPPAPGAGDSDQLRLSPYLGGTEFFPYWFPSCYQSCLDVNEQLRRRYNPQLPSGVDIVNDYLLPQSTKYALESRRFQIELLGSDPRFAGYTVNCVRDMPLIRAGLLDSLDRPRWSTEDWAWHGDGTPEPGAAASAPIDDGSSDVATTAENEESVRQPSGVDLSPWELPVLAMRDGYTDLEPLMDNWNVQWIDDSDVDEAWAVQVSRMHSPVVVTSVLTHQLVDYIDRGGAVILLASKWPGALGSHHHYFWRDAIFVPPVGPWSQNDCNRIVELQPYELNLNTAQVIPVDSLGITDQVDPLLRLFDTHDLSSVVTYDQVMATRAGDGLMIATSLDHTTRSGQWLLGRLAEFALDWTAADSGSEFPAAAIPVDKLHELAVSRINGIMPLDGGWSFQLDEDEAGEAAGWMLPGYDTSNWDTVRAGTGWESLGYSYDGMAWYVREIDAPENWQGGRLKLVAEGIDDAYTVWVNGRAVATHGSFTDHEKTVWLQQTMTELTDYLIPGQTNTLALQVVDITGQGGIWKPVYIAVD